MAVLETPPGVIGKIDVTLIDPSSPGTPPFIIQTNNPFEVKVDWSIDGPTAPFVGGTWHLRLFIQPADGNPNGTHGQLGPTVNVSAGAPPMPPAPAAPRAYSYTYHFGPGSVAAGVYHITAVVTYDNGGRALGMAGFAEIPIMEFVV